MALALICHARRREQAFQHGGSVAGALGPHCSNFLSGLKNGGGATHPLHDWSMQDPAGKTAMTDLRSASKGTSGKALLAYAQAAAQAGPSRPPQPQGVEQEYISAGKPGALSLARDSHSCCLGLPQPCLLCGT